MKVSVSMYSLASTIQKEQWGIIDFLDYAREIGLDGVELLDFYWTDKKREIPEVNQYLEQHGLTVSAYDVSNDFVKANAEERKAEIQKVIDAIYTAKELGTNIVRTFCGDVKQGETFKDGEQWIIEGLREAAKVAEKEKVYLAVENHGLLAGKSEQVEKMIKEVNSPYVTSTFDTGNFLLVHEEPEAAFERLKSSISHVHFKDFREKEEGEQMNGFKSVKGVELIGVVPGDGQVNLQKIVQRLKDTGYKEFLSIEYEGFDDAKEANKEAVNRLRELIGRV
ncbi:sugar phosphate isomerase/epimerase family protein [Jeotgalibacillus terrae]|uniref:Sugar phosphate isomerase/epimerase family protein n=1 Tax=Jeotgalibacillus terrae TaxID=587735 RepID=A0ABW5ZC81_9BACL|nr:sugar phosphate isomerase/epimerase family protein [Jeotgalibacillus terrae]MBM7580115.1 sugar phosphate isomerase/epimerase [Jeotgalibacillus terrae]